MMLGYRYMSVNGVRIPNPISGFTITYDADETINLSEAGTELGRVRRLNKRTFSGDWNVTSFWLDKFREWSTQPTITLTYQGEEITCRMRGFAPKLADNSEYTAESEGLWSLSLTMTEI